MLSEQELTINQALKDLLKQANKSDNLFKNFKEISYLTRPNHLIVKPIIAVIILLGKYPKLKKTAIDYMNKEDIDSVWLKIRDLLKNK